MSVATAEQWRLTVAGHPARSVAYLRIEIEWHVDLSLPSKSMAEIAPQI